MKKLNIILSFILIICFCSGCIKKENQYIKQERNINNEIEYPYKRWDKNFHRFYTDKMLEEYPDILQYSVYSSNYNNHNSEPFLIKRDNNDLAGVYEKDTNKLLIPHKYRNIESCGHFFRYGMFFNAKDKNSRKILSYNNKVVFESNYDNYDCSAFYCGIQTENKGKYGVVSYDGIEVLKPEYNKIECQEHFGESGGWYYIAQKGNKYGVFDNKGNTIIALQDKPIEKMEGNEHFFVFIENGKKGVIDIYGNIVLKPEFYSIELKSAGESIKDFYFVTCKNQTQCTTANIYGETQQPLRNSADIKKLENNYYAVNGDLADEKISSEIFSQKGNKIAKINGNILNALNDKYLLYRTFGKNGGLGVIDYKGNIIMKPEIDDVTDILDASDNGLIKVNIKGKPAIVYRNKIILKPLYHKVYFYRGHVMVLNIEDGEKYYYIANFNDFAKYNGNLTKCKKYHIKQYKKSEDGKCIKFIKPDGEDLYCM